MKWAVNNSCPIDIASLNNAAEIGDASMFKWVHSTLTNCDLSTDIFVSAVAGGNVEIIAYLLDKNCPLDEEVANEAARSGRLDILQLLIKNDCPVDENVCSLSAYMGHLDIIKWARSMAYLGVFTPVLTLL